MYALMKDALRERNWRSSAGDAEKRTYTNKNFIKLRLL
jgi:hypothetical protein